MLNLTLMLILLLYVLIYWSYSVFFDVCGFDSKSRHKIVCAVDAAVSFDTPRMYVLLINHTIQKTGMSSILQCPMPCHLSDIIVNDVPKFFVENPTLYDHAIIIQSGTNYEADLHIAHSKGSLVPSLCMPQCCNSFRMIMSLSIIWLLRPLTGTLDFHPIPCLRMAQLIWGDAL